MSAQNSTLATSSRTRSIASKRWPTTFSRGSAFMPSGPSNERRRSPAFLSWVKHFIRSLFRQNQIENSASLLCWIVPLRLKFHYECAIDDRHPHSPPDAHELPQLSCSADRSCGAVGGAGRAQRRRQNEPHRSNFIAGVWARIAAGDTRRSGVLGRRRIVGNISRGGGRARLGDARNRDRRAG